MDTPESKGLNKIDDDTLDAVAGGYIVYDHETGMDGPPRKNDRNLKVGKSTVLKQHSLTLVNCAR